MELIENPHIQKITEILHAVGERVEGNLICDISPNNWTYHRNLDKIRNLQQLVRGKSKIVEIGVNACHSLVIMLLENPTAEYLLFDLNNHKYTEPTLAYVREAFPSARITAVFGDSVKTLAQYIAEHPEECNTVDFCHLDGGHTEDVFAHDYVNVHKLIRDSAPVIFDDYDLPAIHQFVNRKLAEGAIQPCGGLKSTPYHFVYHYSMK
jgi:hypothetical protein